MKQSAPSRPSASRPSASRVVPSPGGLNTANAIGYSRSDFHHTHSARVLAAETPALGFADDTGRSLERIAQDSVAEAAALLAGIVNAAARDWSKPGSQS